MAEMMVGDNKLMLNMMYLIAEGLLLTSARWKVDETDSVWKLKKQIKTRFK